MVDHDFFGVNSIRIPGLNKIQPVGLTFQIKPGLVADLDRRFPDHPAEGIENSDIQDGQP